MTYQRDFNQRVPIAIVGAGGHCYRNILPTLNYLPIELVAICDPNMEKAAFTAKQYGARPYPDISSMLADAAVDAVLIAVSPQLHPMLTAQAFDAGLHVWMEKPPAMRTSQIDEMLAMRLDRVCVVGFKKAFMPAAQKARDYFAEPSIGPISSLSADYPVTIPKDGAEVLRVGRPTNWLANGCHPLSMMLSVCGKVSAVTAHTNRFGEGALVMEFANGAIGTLNLAVGAGSIAPIERYRFHGKGCTFTIENGWTVSIHHSNSEYKYGVTQSYLADGSAATVWEPQNAFATLENMAAFTQGMFFELDHFCDCILQAKPATMGTLEFARDIMSVYEAALMSEGSRILI